MSGNVFVDTNIFVYAHLSDDSQKHERAKRLLQDGIAGDRVFISTQVVGEFYAALTKYRREHDEIVGFISEITKRANTSAISLSTVERCLTLKRAYGYAYWDSLILAAAIEADCQILYSEDLQNGQVIEGTLTVKNPLID
jgi:predicted nucleic acid-binding protein